MITINQLWSESHKRLMWRKVWVALAEAQSIAGIIRPEQVSDLKSHMFDVDMVKSLEIEKVTRHDLMAEIQCFAEQCSVGGGIIHLGATSADIEENTDAITIRDSLDIISAKMIKLTDTKFNADLIEFHEAIKWDIDSLDRIRQNIRGKGIKGAVGTSASYMQLLKGTNITPRQLETLVMTRLGLPCFQVTTQVAPRKQEYVVGSILSNVGMTIFAIASKLTADGILSRSACYKILSQQNMISAMVGVLWHNASHSLLERTLDDSANRRYTLPTLFLDIANNIETITSCLESESLI